MEKKKKVFVIGIGAGNPDHITVQAVECLNRVDVFFELPKGERVQDLSDIRRTILERFVENRTYRIATAPHPVRDADASDYRGGVVNWHEEKARLYEDLIANALGEGEIGAFLAWGDPSLYDSTIRILERILARGVVAFDYEVIPGITSIQALAAVHKIPLHGIGESIKITTARRLRQGEVDDTENVIVMLDDGTALATVAEQDFDIYWGAFLGTKDEILVSGRLTDVADKIAQARASARKAKGWIMDISLLRKRRGI